MSRTATRIADALRRDLSSKTFLLALALMALFTATRITLLCMTGSTNVPLARWPRVFLLGAWFDALVALALATPFLLLGAVLPDRPLRGRTGYWLRFSGLWLFWSLALFVAASEITFWIEFSARLNFIAVDYLLYTHEVLDNIRESYPLAWILCGIAVGALLPALLLARGPARPPRSWRRRACSGLAALLIPGTVFLCGNIDHMYGSGNTYADELSGNGWMSFCAAMRRNELDYDRFYATIPQVEADRILQRLGVERVPLSQALHPQADEDEEPMGPLRRSPRNLVLISVESLSADFLGCYGGTQGLTPNLDRLAAEGFRFQETYATGTRTVRGLEALSLGIPPIPGQAVVRRPENKHLATLGQILDMQGFHAMFLYGGYGYFDNMNDYFKGNDHQIIDRTDFPKASGVFANAWGVADETLFQQAILAMNRATAGGKRAFAHIMTTSNHRPFTYPDGRIDIPSPGGRKGAVKYTDYAIGQFIEAARKEPWFKDTLFVITADHCASVAGRSQLPVNRYRIPLIFYGPDLVAHGSHEGRISQIDVPPTLLELLGVHGDDYFFGLSIFEQKPEWQRAFISNYQALGYLKRNTLTVLLPRRKVEAYRVDPKTGEQTPVPVDPELRKEAIAYYQTAAHAHKLHRLAAPLSATLLHPPEGGRPGRCRRG